MNIPPYIEGDDQQSYNQDLNQTLERGLGPNGFTVTPLTATQVTTLISFNFRPVMPAGTEWFNSTIKKKQFITDAAIPATSTNAVIETITSA